MTEDSQNSGAGAGRLRRASWRLLAAMPERLQMRINPSKYGFTSADVPRPINRPTGKVRLYIGPVNSAGQGYQWARAAERIDGVVSANMQHRTDRDYGFRADYSLPSAVFVRSRRWQKSQLRAVRRGFTHAMIESQRPLFAGLFGEDLEREIAALRRAGVKIAMVSHGSDLRLPSRHRAAERWSPFQPGEWESTPALEELALKAREVFASVGAPVFVSTPDLLLDWPAAQWLPIVVDAADWANGDPVLERDVPIVLHAPSNPIVKGSDLIEAAVQRLADEGHIDYRRVYGVAASEMRDLYASADIVLEQFRLGAYGVTALEAMASGRLVLGHVGEQVRDHIRSLYGLEVPIVQATPDTVESALRDVVSRRAHYRRIADQGRDFVNTLHDGRESAAAMSAFLGS